MLPSSEVVKKELIKFGKKSLDFVEKISPTFLAKQIKIGEKLALKYYENPKENLPPFVYKSGLYILQKALLVLSIFQRYVQLFYSAQSVFFGVLHVYLSGLFVYLSIMWQKLSQVYTDAIDGSVHMTKSAASTMKTHLQNGKEFTINVGQTYYTKTVLMVSAVLPRDKTK